MSPNTQRIALQNANFGSVPWLHKMAVCRKRFPRNGRLFVFLPQKTKSLPYGGYFFTRRFMEVYFSFFLLFYVSYTNFIISSSGKCDITMGYRVER